MIFAQGYSMEITETRCLNQRHQGVECSHCIRHCPTEAIFLYKSKIYLDKDKCSGCGLCFSDCPTQVFSSKQWDETTIIQDIQEEEWSTTEFFCELHSEPYQKEKGRARGAVQLPACLGIVSKGAWYELALITKIELHLEQCNSCVLSKSLSRLEYNLSVAAEWLEASGHKPEISFIRQSGQGKAKKSLMAIETGLKVTSRRDLFLSLINKGKQLTGNKPNQAESFPEELDHELINSCLPAWQKRLAEVYTLNWREASYQAYWPTIKMNDKCVNCGMCSYFCPSGALQIVVKNSNCIHYFTSGLCLDCRICQLFCPREAISRDREKVEKPFETKTIYSAATIKCQRCDSTTFDNPEHLCYWCQQEAANENELKETCKKLFLKMGN
jgi:ferredoxin